jgi:hypothetical protein
MQMLAMMDKAKPNTENIRRLNLAAVKPTTVSSFLTLDILFSTVPTTTLTYFLFE